MLPSLLVVLGTAACLASAAVSPLPMQSRMASRIAAGSRDVWLISNVAGEIHILIERTTAFATKHSAMGFCATPAGSSTPCPLSWGSSPLQVVDAGTGEGALEVHVGVTGDSETSYTISWCSSTDLTCAFKCPSGCHGQGICDTASRTCVCDPWRVQRHDCETTARYGDYPYDDDDGLPTGAIVGIVVVCVVACLGFAAPLVVLCVCCCGACCVEARNKKRRGAVHHNPAVPADVPVTPYGASAYPAAAYPMQAYPQTVAVAPPPCPDVQMTTMQSDPSYPPTYMPSAPPPASEVACYPPPS